LESNGEYERYGFPSDTESLNDSVIGFPAIELLHQLMMRLTLKRTSNESTKSKAFIDLISWKS